MDWNYCAEIEEPELTPEEKRKQAEMSRKRAMEDRIGLVDDSLAEAADFVASRTNEERQAQKKAIDSLADDTIVQKEKGKQFGSSFSAGTAVL